MTGTFFGLETARRAMYAERKAMDTTGHNIANVNTEGYTRQEAVFLTTEPYAMPTIGGNERPEHLGSGVVVPQIRRIRNEYLDMQVRSSAPAEGYWDSRLDIFQRVEAVFPEPQHPGIQNLMLEFFNNWQELNNTPQDAGVKAVVLETGDELTKLFRETYIQLEDIGKSIADVDSSVTLKVPAVDVSSFSPLTVDRYAVNAGELKSQVDNINNIVSRIKDLNINISKAIKLDKQPNDLLDTRDLLLDKLAGYGTVKISNGDEPGMVAIQLYGKNILTSGNSQVNVSLESWNLKDTATPPAVKNETTLVFDSNESINYVSLTGKANKKEMGALSGLESARLRNKEYMDALDNLAKALTEQINAKHKAEDGTDVNIFTVDDGDGKTGAKYFALADGVKDDPAKINGFVALDVARLRNTIIDPDSPFTSLGTTFEGYYQQLITRVGAGVKESGDRLDNQKAIREQLDSLRESVGGVSLDDELTRMMQFQTAFNAAAKVVSTIDEMLDVVVNGLKR